MNLLIPNRLASGEEIVKFVHFVHSAWTLDHVLAVAVVHHQASFRLQYDFASLVFEELLFDLADGLLEAIKVFLHAVLGVDQDDLRPIIDVK